MASVLTVDGYTEDQERLRNLIAVHYLIGPIVGAIFGAAAAQIDASGPASCPYYFLPSPPSQLRLDPDPN